MLTATLIVYHLPMARKDKKSEPLVGSSQTVRLSSYNHIPLKRNFISCFTQIRIKTRRQMNMLQNPIRFQALSLGTKQARSLGADRTNQKHRN